MDPMGQAMSSWGPTRHTYLVIPTVDGPANSCFTKRMGKKTTTKTWDDGDDVYICLPAFSTGDSDFAGPSTVCLKDQNPYHHPPQTSGAVEA